ncbi:hypothetical protein HEP_00169800 [Hepatocystis sp. ex Piliocolobus tephrosceles]|nr:hypothetical protein HEP_00169800 [Hepatocystis sp. ex Piliocolobus tephrosceles]
MVNIKSKKKDLKSPKDLENNKPNSTDESLNKSKEKVKTKTKSIYTENMSSKTEGDTIRCNSNEYNNTNSFFDISNNVSRDFNETIIRDSCYFMDFNGQIGNNNLAKQDKQNTTHIFNDVNLATTYSNIDPLEDNIINKLNGQIDGQTGGKTEEKTDGKIDEKIDGKIDGKTEEKTDGKIEVKTERQTEVKTDIQTDIQTEVKTERQTEQATEQSSNNSHEIKHVIPQGNILLQNDNTESNNTNKIRCENIQEIFKNKMPITMYETEKTGCWLVDNINYVLNNLCDTNFNDFDSEYTFMDNPNQVNNKNKIMNTGVKNKWRVCLNLNNVVNCSHILSIYESIHNMFLNYHKKKMEKIEQKKRKRKKELKYYSFLRRFPRYSNLNKYNEYRKKKLDDTGCDKSSLSSSCTYDVYYDNDHNLYFDNYYPYNYQYTLNYEYVFCDFLFCFFNNIRHKYKTSLDNLADKLIYFRKESNTFKEYCYAISKHIGMKLVNMLSFNNLWIFFESLLRCFSKCIYKQNDDNTLIKLNLTLPHDIQNNENNNQINMDSIYTPTFDATKQNDTFMPYSTIKSNYFHTNTSTDTNSNTNTNEKKYIYHNATTIIANPHVTTPTTMNNKKASAFSPVRVSYYQYISDSFIKTFWFRKSATLSNKKFKKMGVNSIKNQLGHSNNSNRSYSFNHDQHSHCFNPNRHSHSFSNNQHTHDFNPKRHSHSFSNNLHSHNFSHHRQNVLGRSLQELPMQNSSSKCHILPRYKKTYTNSRSKINNCFKFNNININKKKRDITDNNSNIYVNDASMTKSNSCSTIPTQKNYNLIKNINEKSESETMNVFSLQKELNIATEVTNNSLNKTKTDDDCTTTSQLFEESVNSATSCT